VMIDRGRLVLQNPADLAHPVAAIGCRRGFQHTFNTYRGPCLNLQSGTSLNVENVLERGECGWNVENV
jgi:hypothetical protein